MHTKDFYLATPVLRLFLMTSLPGVVGMLSAMVYFVVDGILVGKMLGATAFAAISLSLPFIVVNFAVADMIGVGGAVLIALSLGAQRRKRADEIFTCSCLLIVVCGCLGAGILYFVSPVAIKWLGAQGQLSDLAIEFVRIYALFAPVTTLTFALDNFLKVCGKARLSMWLNIVMSAVIISLEFLFLVVFEWGLWAASLAACIGMSLMVLIALTPFMLGRFPLRFRTVRWQPRLILRIFANGFPGFINNIAGRVTSIALNAALLHFGGETAVVIYGVIMYLGDIAQTLLYGVYDAVQPSIGYNWAAQRKDRVGALSKYAAGTGCLIGMSCMTLLWLFPETVVGVFVQDPDAEFMRAALPAIELYGFSYAVRWFSFFVLSFATSIGRPTVAAVVSVSASLVFPLLLIGLLWPFELYGLWLNFPLASLMTAVFAGTVGLWLRRDVRRG